MIAPPCRGALLLGRRRYISSLLVFGVSCTVGGGVAGGVIGIAGRAISKQYPMLHMALVVIVLAIATVYGLYNLLGHDLSLPTPHWQVPRRWANFGALVFSGAFGLVLGTGMFTFVLFAGYYVMLGICLITGSPFWSAAVMGAYGTGRMVPVVIAPVVAWCLRKPYRNESAIALNQWLAEQRGIMLRLHGFLLLISGTLLALTVLY